MIKKIIFNLVYGLFISLFLVSCSSVSTNLKQNEQLVKKAEESASLNGKKILEATYAMIKNQEIIRGGCWDYINAVYDRVGLTIKDRLTIFKSKFQGPYVGVDVIQPGDWLYFVNHTYRDSEHSAIFVEWTNIKNSEALMVSYAGEKKKVAATYKRFVIDKVYNIIRGRE